MIKNTNIREIKKIVESISFADTNTGEKPWSHNIKGKIVFDGECPITIINWDVYDDQPAGGITISWPKLKIKANNDQHSIIELAKFQENLKIAIDIVDNYDWENGGKNFNEKYGYEEDYFDDDDDLDYVDVDDGEGIEVI